MTANSSPPSWYDEDDLRSTVRDGVSAGVDTEQVAAILAERMFDSVPLSRVEAIIETTRYETEEKYDITSQFSQSPSTNSKPRETPTRGVTVGDLGYLTSREAGRVVGLALELFDGNTVRLPANEVCEADLVWRRQHTSVAVRVVPVQTTPTGTTHVDALVDGKIVPDDVQSPPDIAIVTNGTYTDDAVESAEEHDIRCFDAGHVEAWFRRAQFSMNVVGTILEEGEDHDGPLTELVDVDPIPEPRQSTDPMEIERAFDPDSIHASAEQDASEPQEQTTTTELDRTTVQDDPLGGTQSPPGEKETLYADPDEDGDYDMFDDYLDDL